MPSKRPFKFTTQEIATIFWCIGLFIIVLTLYMSYGRIYTEAGYYMGFIIPLQMILFFIIGLFFMFLGFAFPCYQISKWNCNPYMDKLEQGWDIWLRTSKSRKYSAQCVQTGPLGQMKGLVSGHKADIINRGDFPVTLQNGNHAVIKYDLMSHNVNFNEAIGWRLISRKYGFIGVNAFRRCISEEKTVKKESWSEKRKKEKEAKKA